MAIYFSDRSTCAFCQRKLGANEDIVAFTAFLPEWHRWFEYSDGAFHAECFARWPNSKDFENLYRRWRFVWDTRPANLSSVEEMDEWGKAAFKEFEDLLRSEE